MSESVAAPATVAVSGDDGHHVDAVRVRSFVGLVLARLGPRAYGLASGTFLALLLAAHTDSLFAVTFALTANRLANLVVYPLVGRWSDGTHSLLGRRTPYMAVGLTLMAACTFFFPSAGSYAVLVALVFVARTGRSMYTLTSTAVTPEVFGRSRWIKALVATTVGGLVVGVIVRVTIITTWERDDASTWGTTFRLVALFIGLSALAVMLLVREAPAARELPDPTHGRWRDQVRDLLSRPNARALGGAVVLALAASGATDRVYPVYAQEALGASGSDLAAAGFFVGPLTIVTAVPIGLWMAGRFTRRQIAIGAPLLGALGGVGHLFITSLWQSIAIGIVTTPLLVASLVSMAPFALALVPRSGGFGERLGVLLGPLGLVGVAASWISAVTVDQIVHDTRAIWAFSAVLTAAIAIPLSRIRVPAGHERADVKGMGRELFGALRRSRRATQDTGLFTGVVTREDADAVGLVEALRRIATRYGYDDGTADPEPAPSTERQG